MIGDLWQKGTRVPRIPSIVQAAGTAIELIRMRRAYAVAVSAAAIAAVAVTVAGVGYIRHADHAGCHR